MRVLAPDGSFIAVSGEPAVLGVDPAGFDFDCILSVDLEKGTAGFRAPK